MRAAASARNGYAGEDCGKVSGQPSSVCWSQGLENWRPMRKPESEAGPRLGGKLMGVVIY